MSIVNEWSAIRDNLAQLGATQQDMEEARQKFAASIPQKAKAAGLDDVQTQSAVKAFDAFTQDGLTEDERWGMDNPIKGGLKQAGKEMYTALAQGAGRLVGGAARLYNDIGDNEKGTFADNLANAMDADYERLDEEAGLGYQHADGVRGFAKMMAQNIPQLALSYAPLVALKGVAALRGAKAAATAVKAGASVQVANAAKAAAIANTIKKGSLAAKAASVSLNATGEYGDVSHTVAQKLKQDTVEDLRNSAEYGAEFEALERDYYQQGLSAEEASQKAKEYLLDNIRERRADVGAAVNTALEWIAPNAISGINKLAGAKAGGELTERAVADAIGNKRFSWGSKQEFANLGEQMAQEGAQEGFTEYLGEDARANVHNDTVDWGSVAKSVALGAAGGGIMGHGIHTFTTGGHQAGRAKVLQQLEAVSTGYQSATQAVADGQAALAALTARQGTLSAAEIATKQQLEQDIALNQQVATAYATQLEAVGALSPWESQANPPVGEAKAATMTQADSELKAMAERGETPDFEAMAQHYGVGPDDLAKSYGRHQKRIELKNTVAEHLKQGDTEAAHAVMNQAGMTQEEADAILDEAIRGKAQPKQPKKPQADTPLTALSELLSKKPDADFATEVLPFLKKKHKVTSTSEALALWNEARKVTQQNKQVAEDEQAFQQANAQLEADAKRKAQAQQQAKEQGIKQDALTEQQQLENTLADFAAENDTDSMLALLEGYEQKEADKLFNQAFKTAEARAKEAEKAAKAQEADAAKQAQAKQQQDAFTADMATLYATNPDATFNDWRAVGKKHGVTSAMELATAWNEARKTPPADTQQATPKEPLALPAPESVMVTDAQGSGQASGNPIVRTDGKPFETEQKANQALKNRAKKPRKPKEQPISEETHHVAPIEGGFAIVPVEQVEPIAQQEAKAEPTVAVNTESQLDTVQGTQAATESGNNTESPVLSDREIHVKLMARSNELVNLAHTNNKQSVTDSEYADEFLAIQALANPFTHDEVILDYVDLIIKLVTSLNNPSITRFALDSLKKAYARVAKDQQEKTAKGQHTSFRKADDPKRAAHQAKLDEMRIAAEEAMKKGLQGINQLENLGTKPKKEETPTPKKIVTTETTQTEPTKNSSQLTEATDKGYDINWGDEVQSFNGKNAVEKTKAALAREKFNKKKPDQEGEGGITVDPTPNKPVSPSNTTQTPKTTGEQIAEAFDKTAKAITEASHAKVVERVKNGEEIVYKQPAAIERAKQDDRYQVEINDKGHAVVKNIKDSNGEWVKKPQVNGFTDNQKPTKPFSAPSENSPETTIMRFLNDGELENAYFFAENQDKPIKFTLSEKKEPIAYFLTEPVDLGNGIKGFVGLASNVVNKEGRKNWLVIEEKSRKSIGFEEISKQAAIKSAKARLSSLKKEDLEGLAAKITPINKTDEEMKADWLAKNNIKIDEQSNEQNSINRKTENLAPAEKAQQVKKEPQKAEQPKQDKPIKKTPIQGKDIWMEVEFIAGNKSKELFYHNRMTDPNKPFNTEAEAIADWESKTEEQSKEQSNSTIEETKQPTKKERLLIKIDDELDAALDDLANVFKEQGKRLSSGVDPVIMGKVLAIGMKASTLYLAKGAVKFAVWAENIIASLSSKGVAQDLVEPYLKGLYLASKAESSPEIRQQMDKEDDVYDFDFAILNESNTEDTQNVTTPSQTNRDNAGERDKTPESSQVQRASESGLTQDNSEKRDDGVSTNSGGRSDGRNNSNESGESETRSQQPNVASTRSKSPKLGDSTRSTEPSDGTNLRNYRIQPNELKRTGTWKATAEQNVQIVELVKSIVAENRSATPEEKALLTKFTGWGASEIANGIFPNQYGSYKDANWKALGERLEAALTPEEYAQAKRTTQYAHYTSEPIIRSVYAALSRFGFNGGSMIEPGMGVGLFNGLMPDAMANNSQYTGIEYDTITGNIAKLLYPDSNVIVGDFTQTKLPKNFFDVAVGNPPFGSIKIQSDPEYKKQGFLLHDYFFAKTIDRVKEGGLLVFVTSKGTMDKANDRARKYLSERADLVGAIRLPQTAFKDNAGTEVVTDVIFLRKRTAEQEPAGEAWGSLKEISTPQGNASINEYFANHPEMILGKSALTGSMYRANEYTVEPIAGSDIETLFSEAINNLPENIYKPQQGTKAEQAAVQRRDYDPKIKKEGSIYVADDGVLMQVSNGQGSPLTQKQNSKHELVDLKPKEKEWLKDYVGVRDALKQAQYDQLQDNANWQKSLDALNKTYDAFVKKHGFMLDHTVSERENEDGSVTVTKRYKNKSIILLDAESALINALEQINGDNSISKAPALLGRVINKPSTPVITSTQDAMFVVFNELGRFDLAKVAKLINKPEKEVIAELGDSIYEDPSQSWTTSDDYLSGNVVSKLKEAEQAARLNPKYQRNVTALKAVQPPALAPQDINVQLGAAWIPASDVTQFASEILSERFRVNYSPLTGQWSVEGNANYSSEWGIPAKNSQDILEAVLNNRQIKVTFLDENKKTHTDTEKTEKANDIAKKMRQSFKKWLWEDVSRTERLVTYYNEHFNNIAPRVFDGQHLTLPGVSSRFDLRPHQKRAIWRTIQQGDVYYAHAVGAGKTFTMIASGMEERRLGLVEKPMYVVPNHMLAQFSKEFLELYPMANIMVADEANFHTHNRRKFVAQAALNNPDAIVITHSAFGRIGMSSEYSSKFIKNQIDDWQIALQEVGSDERITRKQIERRIEQLENKLKALLDGEKDQLLNFEELGVDRLYVDEGHEFRKLDFPTNRGNIKGIDPSGSQKSMDLYMKVEYLRGKNPNRALVMASGTPITNTMGELFTVQRFFNPSQLEEDGDSSFDAWSAHYGEVVDGLEQNAAGGYETVSRFAKFVNVPELMSRVRYFMDILTSNQLGDLVQRPDVVGGGRQVIVTPAPDGYKDYQKDLERRIKAIRDRKAPPKPGDDIILSVIGDGRFSAIDMRFVDSTLPSDPNSKLNRMLDDLISAYHETANNEYVTSGVIDENKGSSLMLFTDIGLGEQSAKNRGFDMKAWIEKRLVEGGVKREHIAFMRDNKAHSKKEKLFDDMRQGKKRILIGGKDMETGVNAQKRLTHLFHLDAPWFPASVEQREGRIIRQGNQNKIVAIRAYASKGSYDSTMWGMNSRKARFIEQAMSGDSSIRNMEDVSEASAFEMAAALASGDERYLKLAGLKGDVERLSRLYSAHIDEQKRFAREKAHLESQNKHSTSKIEQINEAIAKRKPIKAGEFLANVGKQSFDSREDFSKALFEKFKEVAESYKADEVELGSIAGFPIVYNGVELRGGNFAADLRVDLPIDAEPLAIFPIDPAYSVSGIATRAVNQTNALDRELVSRKSSIEQNTKDLARIGRRIGASFPEMAELNEKQQALNELEQELNAESKANDGLEQSIPQDTDSKPKFSQARSGLAYQTEGLSPDQAKALLANHPVLKDALPLIDIVDSEQSIPDDVLRSMGIYRVDAKDFDYSAEKPHGLYVSIPDDVKKPFDSPHDDTGDTAFSGYASPEKPLIVENLNVQHARGRGYPIPASAGIAALANLTSKEEFDSLLAKSKAELIALIAKQYPAIDTSKYHDAYELLEVLGAQKAKENGYDAIILKEGDDPFNEMVILDHSIIDTFGEVEARFSNRLAEGRGGISPLLDSESGVTEGYFHKGRITLFANNIHPYLGLSAEERLIWVAFHEITHRGVAALSESKAYLAALEQAAKNRFIKNLASKIQAQRAAMGEPISESVAIEEAIAEANAALQSGNASHIKNQYGLNFPKGIQPTARNAVQRFFEAVRAIIHRVFGRGLTDAQLGNLLRVTQQAGMSQSVGNDYEAAVYSIASDSGKPTTAQVAEAKRQLDEQPDIRFSRKAKESTEQNLIITHNLSPENLLHAVKMGGLAVPSLAITTKDEALTGFGSITLIGRKEMADPKGYAKTKAFGADIYSPRYPQVERTIDAKGYALLEKRTQAMSDELGINLVPAMDLGTDGYNELERSPVFLGQFLKDNNIKPAVVWRESMKPERSARLREFGLEPFMGETDFFDLKNDEAFRKAGLAEILDRYSESGKYEFFIKKIETDKNTQNSLLSDLAREITNAAKLAMHPEVERYATLKAMMEQIENASLRGQYVQAVNDILEAITKEERIFQGRTSSGNRRYIPHTLENVVKLLKKNLRGGEGVNYGVGSLRALFTPQFNSVDAIRNAKDRLVSAERFEQLKNEINKEFQDVVNAISPDLGMSAVSDILAESVDIGIRPAFKNHGYDISDDAAAEAQAFIDKLRVMPTEYFEAKILRSVDLSEFVGAVVPDNLSDAAMKALRTSGITDIRTYTEQDEKSRKEAIQAFTNDNRETALFSLKDVHQRQSHAPHAKNSTAAQVRAKLVKHFGEKIISLLEKKGILKIHQSLNDESVPKEALRQTAYHGSPFKFDKFSLEHIGKGEGNQAYGWGLYFAGKKATAEWYRKKLSEPLHSDYIWFKGNHYDITDPTESNNFVNELVSYYGTKRRVAAGAILKLRENNGLVGLSLQELRNKDNKTTEEQDIYLVLMLISIEENNKPVGGQLYDVNIPEDDNMLLWDKPLSEQPKAVKRSLQSLIDAYEDLGLSTSDIRASIQFNETGEAFYRLLTRRTGSQRNASIDLKDNGIIGIKYLDGSSRSDGDGTYNYVVFDDTAVQILKTYYSVQQGATEGFYLNGTVHLIADNLTDNTIIGTFVHELGGHKGFQEMMSPAAYALIMERFNRLVEANNPIAVAAKQRAEEAETDKARQESEYLPYLITEQSRVQATTRQRNAVQRLIDHMVRAVKGWVVRTLSKYDTTYSMSRRVAESLTPADILYMAERMVGEVAKTDGFDTASVKFSKAEQSQFEQLLKQADAMIAKHGKLLAPNGQPSKLNRVQWAQVRTDNFKKWFGDWENDARKEQRGYDPRGTIGVSTEADPRTGGNAGRVWRLDSDTGEPKTFFHGTKDDIEAFDLNHPNRKDIGWLGRGIYVASDVRLANAYANLKNGNNAANIMPLFVAVKNPLVVKPDKKKELQFAPQEDADLDTQRAKELGHDGVVTQFPDGTIELVAFHPTQIKSALGNNGEFSPTNPDIRFSKKSNTNTSIEIPTNPERSTTQQSAKNIKDLAKWAAEGLINTWVYRIGTKLDIALKNPRYKRVFDLVQAHLNHVNVEAYKAIELAPDLLGRLDTFADYKKRLKLLVPSNFDERNKNIDAVAKVVFDGTLIDKKEFSEAELRTKGLTDDQITLYKQARAAINISLNNAAKAEMTRELLMAEVIGEQVARVITDRELTMDEHKRALLTKLDEKYQALKAKREATTGKKAKAALEQQMQDLVEVIKSLHRVTKEANRLTATGYAPLMRYGDYTASIYDDKGELVDFRMFETKSARDEFVTALAGLNLNMAQFNADKATYDDAAAKAHKGFKVIAGTMNNSQFEQFKGVTPEVMALFADKGSMKQSEAYQAYLKLAVSNNSAFKRLIHRKGMAGYSEDLQRVVASFVMSNARRSAKNIYNKLENAAVNAIPKEQGYLQEDAQKLVNYINNPEEEAQGFRNILFMWNLGASVTFGLVNLTQPFLVTIPKLSEYTTASDAKSKVLAAAGEAFTATKEGKAPKGFEEEYEQARREGHLDPQGAFVLAGIERGNTGLSSSYWQSLSHGMGLIAQVTESMNRKTVFIAAMQIGQELQKAGKLKAQGFDSPYDFAIRIIQETQGIYNKGNRGNFARGAIGTVLMMFKQYPIMLVQLMGRMAVNPHYAGEKDKYRKALLLMLALLWGVAGLTGLPGVRDIFDVAETALALGDKPTNIEREIQIGLGKDAADWLMNGAANNILPFDIKGRMGMGDLIPTTSLMNPVTMSAMGSSQNKEMMQVLGAGGGFVQKMIDGSSALGRGDYRNAAANLAPRAIESAVKGIEMGLTGVYTDRKGNKVRDVSQWDALMKFLDMNPSVIAKDSRTRGLEARDAMIQGYVARNFKEDALDALAENDMAKMDKVDKAIEKWNRENPRYPVEINTRALHRKLLNKSKTWQGRNEPPKGMEWWEQYR